MGNYFGTKEEVEAARAKRRAEVQAWAREDQARADALIGVPTSFDSDWDLVEIEDADEPEEVEIPASSDDAPAQEITTEEVAPKAAKTSKPKPEATSKG